MNRQVFGTQPAALMTVPGSAASCVPILRPEPCPTTSLPAGPETPAPRRSAARKETTFPRDALLTVWRNRVLHVVSENYFYKTEPYYTILRYEMDGIPVRPSSAAVLDACVVPVCLERARIAGIPVCEWGISQGYTPLPSLIYGLNYFATSAEYTIVRDNTKAKEAVRHITNKGKYPFCYQKLPDKGEVRSCTAIFGKTSGDSPDGQRLARQVYDLFGIPLVTIVYVDDGDRCLLSSLSPARYSRLTEGERSILSAHLAGQEFL